jgi:hypothetical protein
MTGARSRAVAGCMLDSNDALSLPAWELSPRQRAFAADGAIAQVPVEHQRRADHVERVQEPDRPRRQVEDVDGVHHVAHVGQGDVAEAVRRQIARTQRLAKHRQHAAGENDAGDDSREHRHRLIHALTVGTRHAGGIG